MTPIHITYYVHGATADNEKGIASGWADAELSELGKRQCMQLREMIKGKRFDAVFCSDLKRAVESAKLCFGKSMEIIQDKRLRELDYGDMTRVSSDKVDSAILKHINKPFPGGESYKDVENRLRRFLDDLLKKYPGKNVAIVGHRAPQLALDVLLKGSTWEQAVKEDWRLRKAWQPGWEYKLDK